MNAQDDDDAAARGVSPGSPAGPRTAAIGVGYPQARSMPRNDIMEELRRLREVAVTLANDLSSLMQRLERGAGCDHKFIDSTHCLKCGWTP